MPGIVIMGLPERFWAKTRIADCGYETPCVIWTAYCLPNGYGRVGWKGATRYAHRVAYEAQVGKIPDGLMIDHLCRNRACVNVSHLEPVTNRVNILRGETIMAAHAAQTHCISKHPFDEANTIWRNGHRICAACTSAARVARNEQRRTATASRPPKPLRTHCRNRHLLDDANTFVNKAGVRCCRRCSIEAGRRYRESKRHAS